MQIRRLPADLLDEILSHLKEDRVTLVACRSTSRSMVPRSRCYLFHHVTIRRMTDYSRFLEVLHEAPRIASHVKSLELVADYIEGEFVDVYWPPFLPLFINVEELSITEFRSDTFSDLANMFLQDFIKQIKTLRLRYVALNWPGLNALIFGCPRLSTLYMEDVCAPPEAFQEDTDFPVADSVEALSWMCGNSTTEEWAYHTFRPKMLELDCEDGRNGGEFLRDMIETVEYLVLLSATTGEKVAEGFDTHAWFGIYHPSPMRYGDLLYIHLKDVGLERADGQEQRSGYKRLRWMFGTMDSLVRCNILLQHFEVSFRWIDLTNDQDRFDWDMMDNALTALNEMSAGVIITLNIWDTNATWVAWCATVSQQTMPRLQCLRMQRCCQLVIKCGDKWDTKERFGGGLSNSRE